MAYDIAMRKLCPLITALFFAFPALAAERVTATGKIVDATNAPIANATVMVYSAGAKEGLDLFCPTCYVDCGKRAVTSAEGDFTIPGLSSDLLFNLLVVREGFSAEFIKKVNPTKGPVAPAVLKQRTSPDDVSQIVRGNEARLAVRHIPPAALAKFYKRGMRQSDHHHFAVHKKLGINRVAVPRSNPVPQIRKPAPVGLPRQPRSNLEGAHKFLHRPRISQHRTCSRHTLSQICKLT